MNPTSTAAVSRSTDRGAGLLGTLAGFFVFVLLLFAAVQVLFNLYATSMVTGAAYDAARVVAGFDNAADRCAAVTEGNRVFAEEVGRYLTAGHASLAWTCTDPDVVRLEVTADHPTVLPARLGGLLGLTHLERTIVIRVEDRR